MKMLVLDLEMNQPSKQIIQIGYIIVDTRTQEELCHTSLYVDPKEAINPEIEELTGISDKIIKQFGKPLREQYDLMLKDCKTYGVTSLPAQWGIGDTDLLREQLGLSWDEFIFRRRAIDVKSIYQAYAAFGGETTKVGLQGSMKKLGLEFIGRPHDALCDAHNTYRVLQLLANKMRLSDKILKAVGEK